MQGLVSRIRSFFHRWVALCWAAALLPLALPAAEAPLLSTDKSRYDVDENVLVTARGAGKDWVGVYKRGETPGGARSICWYYVAQGGHASGDTVGLHDSNPDLEVGRSELFPLPEGEYSVFLLRDDGYEQAARVDVTVGSPAPPNIPPPLSIAYAPSSDKAGFAAGEVVLRCGAPLPDSFLLRWGDAEGALPGYAPFAPIACTGETTRCRIADHVALPSGATRLLAWSVKGGLASESPAEAPVPAPVRKDWEKSRTVFEMQVVSDTHVRADRDHLFTRHFRKALEDIAAVSPDSIGVFVVGDLTDGGTDAEYETFLALVRNFGSRLPPFHAVAGNHDLTGPLGRFLQKTGNNGKTAYFDRRVGGVHCIFLSGDRGGLRVTLGETQLAWLADRLAEGDDPDKPVFLFLHQALKDTVAGSRPGQNWDGVDDADALRAVLTNHPNAILFTGHSHWELNSENTMFSRIANFPVCFNTASVGYTWSDRSQKTGVPVNGSEGYFLQAKEDGLLLVRGRDFDGGLWLPSAQFIVEPATRR